MSRLAETVRERIDASPNNTKDIASAIHTTIEGEEGRAKATFKTVQEKLSKLANGDPEGERFFMDVPERLHALATALDIEPERLVEQRDVVDLILDPELPEGVRAYFQERERSLPDRVRCVSVSSDGSKQIAREHVRQAIRSSARRPTASVVLLADSRDADFFAGAGLRTTEARKHPRGYVLTGYENLVPLPEPPPAKLHDERGVPMVPCPEVAAKFRRRDGYWGGADTDLHHRVHSAEECGETPTFYLHEVWEHTRSGQHLPQIRTRTYLHRVSWPGAIVWALVVGEDGTPEDDPEILVSRCFEVLLGLSPTTILWRFENKLFGLGKHIDDLREMLAPYYEVVFPEALNQLFDVHWKLNPWRFGAPVPKPKAPVNSPRAVSEQQDPIDEPCAPDHPWPKLRGEILERTGLDFDAAVFVWRRHIGLWNTAPLVNVSLHEGPIEEARRLLADLSEREFLVPVRFASSLLEIQQVTTAPMIAIAPAPNETAHVLANMGAGRLLRLRFLVFPNEKKTAVRLSGSGYDAGNIRVWQYYEYDQVLEGSHLAARERRRQQEQQDDD